MKNVKQSDVLASSGQTGMSRRTFLGVMAGVVAGATMGNVVTRGWLEGEIDKPNRDFSLGDVAALPVTIITPSGMRVHGIQTGLLAIKQAHAEVRGPVALRFPSIIFDQHWTDLLPILTWVIEHPEGLIVIDTGEIAAATDINTYLASDPPNRWFLNRNLPMFVSPAEELATQMRGLDLDPAAVDTVILTHLHVDHAGGLGFFPQAQFLLARAEYKGHMAAPRGSVQSVWPDWFQPTLIDYLDAAVGSFPASYSVTDMGDVVILPTHGHSYGHQSVLLRDGEQSYLFAGDVAFSDTQLRARGLQGIAHDITQASVSIQRTLDYMNSTPTVFLPTHDPGSLARLEQNTIFTL